MKMQKQILRTKALRVMDTLSKCNVNPRQLTDDELLKYRNVGRAVLAEIRAITGPGRVVRVRKVCGFESWWRHEGRYLQFSAKGIAHAAWRANAVR